MFLPLPRRNLLKLGLLLALPLSFGARPSGRPVGVVELFTSQGCSRCPPADALFKELSERNDVVALAYHVNYWDYLGWKDDLATPENTDRQNAYGRVFNSTVYTPQAVVNGVRNIVGSDRDSLYAALDEARSGTEGLAVDISLSMTRSSVVVDIGGTPAESTGAYVILIYVRPRQTVEIRAGENKGKTIEYHNIVTGYQTVGMWHGKPMRLELPRPEIENKGGRCAVLVQMVDENGNPGRILGAAQIAGF